MAALTEERDTPRRGENSVADLETIKLAASTKIYAGSLVCKNATGNAVPGTAATTLVAMGRAEYTVDNSTGLVDTKSIDVRPGTFRWGNSSAGDLIAKADVGTICYVVDDQTVAKTSGGSTRSVAGKVVEVDSLGVWVRTGIGLALT